MVFPLFFYYFLFYYSYIFALRLNNVFINVKAVIRLFLLEIKYFFHILIE